jgi:hypothetical protein
MATLGAGAVLISAQRPDSACSTLAVKRPHLDLAACDPFVLGFRARGFLNAFW